MTPNDIARVQDYLRRSFGNERINIVAPTKRNEPVLAAVVHREEAEAFVGVEPLDRAGHLARGRHVGRPAGPAATAAETASAARARPAAAHRLGRRGGVDRRHRGDLWPLLPLA